MSDEAMLDYERVLRAYSQGGYPASLVDAQVIGKSEIQEEHEDEFSINPNGVDCGRIPFAGRPIAQPDRRREITRLEAHNRSLIERNRLLEEANAAIASQNRDLEDFSHIAAHDLKEPLRGIRDPERTDNLIIRVADNGIGMDERTVASAFVMFRRGVREGEFGEGSGVGLALCQRIAERLGAKIRVDTSPGEGSTFSIVLPPTCVAKDTLKTYEQSERLRRTDPRSEEAATNADTH